MALLTSVYLRTKTTQMTNKTSFDVRMRVRILHYKYIVHIRVYMYLVCDLNVLFACWTHLEGILYLKFHSSSFANSNCILAYQFRWNSKRRRCRIFKRYNKLVQLVFGGLLRLIIFSPSSICVIHRQFDIPSVGIFMEHWFHCRSKLLLHLSVSAL